MFWFQRNIAPLWCLTLIASAIFAVYWQTFNNPIFFDSATALSDAELRRYAENFNLLSPRLLSLITFNLTDMYLGTDWFCHNVINVILHVLTAGVLYVFFRLVFIHAFEAIKENNKIIHPTWLACFAALAFALSPATVYGPAYLAQRTIVMATLFSIVTLIFYFKGLVTGRKRWFALSVLAFYVAIHCKEHCVAIPGIAFLLTIWMEGFNFKTLKRHSWVYALFLLVIAQILFHKDMSGIATLEHEPEGVQMIELLHKQQVLSSQNLNLPLLNFVTQSYAFFRYLYLWLIPDVRLMSIDTQLPFATSFWFWPYTLTFILFFAFMVVSARVFLSRNKITALAGLGFLFPLVLFVTEFYGIRVSEVFVLYRGYLWMSALFLFFPALFQARLAGYAWPRAKVGLFVAYLAILIMLTHERLNTFDSEKKVWQDAVNKIDTHDTRTAYKNYRAYNNLAFTFANEGNFDAAIPYYNKALLSNPTMVAAHTNLGFAFINKKRYQEASQHFNTALTIVSKHDNAYLGLGVLATEQGQFEGSLDYYKKGLEINSNNADLWYNLGNSYLNLKQPENAAEAYQKSVAIRPQFIGAWFNLGLAYGNMGKIPEAINTFKQCLIINPNDTQAKEILAALLQRH
ncbi:tetratricopeptide repeat protein [bacterium]|nr:tetratricopeptide repeat protein [bacterium]